MHIPVLLNESIEALEIKPNGVYVDATYGGGGHSSKILEKLNDDGRLYVFDQDEDAENRKVDDSRLIFINENFRHIKRFLRLHNVRVVDGILADLGMSSFQLDSEERGFSTRFDAPLDMRMKQSRSRTAANVLNEMGEYDLQLVFQNYGELRNSKSLAKEIVRQRSVSPFEETGEFIERIDGLIKGNRNRYLAQVFQALRIEVNEEMDVLKEFLQQSAELIRPDSGRLAVITFHSLEDRLVKRFFKTGTFDGQVEKDVFGNFEKPLFEVNRKPILPTEVEVAQNSRSRSAKLRIAKVV